MSLLNREVARLSWWQVRTSVRFRIVLALAAVPLAAGILTIVSDGLDASRAERTGRDPLLAFSPDVVEPITFLVLYAMLPLTALLLAGGLLADDVEDRTLSYLLVRPVRRATLYFSKLLPVALATGALGALQALLYGLTRLLAWSLYGQGATVRVRIPYDGLVAPPVQTVDAGPLILVASLGAILAAFLLGVALAALFGFVSLVVPKFHFIANLLVYLALELPFSNIGAAGFGFLTPTLHARTLLSVFDLAVAKSLANDLGVAGAVLAAPMLLLLIALWTWLGLRRVRSKDFNVTSATG